MDGEHNFHSQILNIRLGSMYLHELSSLVGSSSIIGIRIASTTFDVEASSALNRNAGNAVRYRPAAARLS